MQMGELIYLSDKTLEEMEKRRSYWEFTPKMAQRYIRSCDIVLKLFDGKLLGYEIKCPHCGETYKIPLSYFNYNDFIKCYKCDKEYRQDKNIIKIIWINDEGEDND